MNLKENFSKNVKEMRRLKHKTMDEFASELGIGKSTLQGIEQKKSNSTLETVQTVSERLEISPLALLSDEMKPQELKTAVNLLGTLDIFGTLPEKDRAAALDLFEQLVNLLSKNRPKEKEHGTH